MPEVEVVNSPEDAEHADCVVCAPLTEPLVCPDNIVGECSECGSKVQWRPNAPKTPPRVCWNCAAVHMVEEEARGELGIMVTQKTVDELKAYRDKRRN